MSDAKVLTRYCVKECELIPIPDGGILSHEAIRDGYEEVVLAASHDAHDAALRSQRDALAEALKPFVGVWLARESGLPFLDAVALLYPVDFEQAFKAAHALAAQEAVKYVGDTRKPEGG